MLEVRTASQTTHPSDLRPAEEADAESDVTLLLHDRELSEASTVAPSPPTQAGYQAAQTAIEDMVTYSIALRSNSDTLIEPVAADRAAALFSPSISSGSGGASLTASGTSPDVESLPRLVRSLLSLQQEILLLRNDLNFETWLSKENVKHIERLYQSHVLSKTAEFERQALVRTIDFFFPRRRALHWVRSQFNKLRKYRLQVVELENELREHKEQTSSAKSKFAEYSNELHKKIQSLREQKANWNTEAADLRRKEKEAQARL
jgi:hypothetical protein